MSEYREDLATGARAVVAPTRGKRPAAGRGGATAAARACPFCPGNEAMLPEILWQMAAPEAPGWRTRAVANRYPAFTTELGEARAEEPGPLYRARDALGRQEVLVEHPRHDLDLALMPVAAVGNVVEMYRQRYAALMADRSMRAVIPFRNHGARAGASLGHPHSQIIALTATPPLLRARLEAARRHYRRTDRCAYCDLLAHERADGRRVVSETDGFLALVPFAATTPCELWLVPKRHCPDFGQVAEEEAADLAALLSQVLRRLRSALEDPPYNYAIVSAPREARAAPHFHWHLRLLPSVAVAAGFELAAGLAINPSSPEADAALLRHALGRRRRARMSGSVS